MSLQLRSLRVPSARLFLGSPRSPAPCLRHALTSLVALSGGRAAWPNEPGYELRLAKYAERGFAVAVPGLQTSLVDWQRAAMGAPLTALRGVARLLLIDADRAMVLQQVQAHNSRFRTLVESFGRRLATASYHGFGDTRSLPAEGENDRHVQSDWISRTSDPGVATDERPEATAWTLVVAANELDGEDGAFNVGSLDQEDRDAHWATILDAGRDNLLIPRKLEWSSTPRTREYLNAADGPSIDVAYFVSAYPPYGGDTPRTRLRPVPVA